MATTASFVPAVLDRDAPFYVAGHRGLVGSAIWRMLEAQGFTNLVGRTSGELDLRDRDAAFSYLTEEKPRYLVLAAATAGGILANDTYPVDFLSDNLRIQVNVMDAALESGVDRLLSLDHPASTLGLIGSRSQRTPCSRVIWSRPTTLTRSLRSRASCRSKRCGVSMGCPGFRPCQRTSTVLVTTSLSLVHMCFRA